jgi:methionyl-tRNA formyltransferase
LSEGIDAEPGTVFGHTRVATGEGALELVEVQPEGRRSMDANAWLAGRRAADPLLGT